MVNLLAVVEVLMGVGTDTFLDGGESILKPILRWSETHINSFQVINIQTIGQQEIKSMAFVVCWPCGM